MLYDDIPLEIFYQILELTLRNFFDNVEWKRELASVSRRWKGIIILSTPMYWTRIAIPPLLKVSILTAHLRRSRKCLLDVEIIVYLGAAALRPSLSAAISSVHRWCSIRTYLGGTGEQLQILFDHLNFS